MADTGPGPVKFDDSGDQLVVAFSGSPGQLGYRLKGQPGTGTATSGTFIVEQSTDGNSWTTVRGIVNKSNTDESFADILSPTTRYVSFRYQTKLAGNLQFDALTISPGAGWQAWLGANSLTDAAAEPGADPDGDGISNLAEYAMALSPTTADASGLPQAELQGGHLAFTFRLNKSAADLSVTPQTSATLAEGSWTGGGMAETARQDKGSYWVVTVSDNSPVTENPRRFVRLQIRMP